MPGAARFAEPNDGTPYPTGLSMAPGDRPRRLTLSAGKTDLVLDPAWSNAAGMLGFSDESRRFIDPRRMGALVTNPVSLKPRAPARGPRTLRYPGGLLLHTGHPNPGLSAVVRDHGRRWRNLSCPVIVHILAGSPEESARLAERLEAVEEVAGLEIGLEAAEPESAAAMVSACRGGQKPILAQLPLTTTAAVIQAVTAAGASAVVLGPPRGCLPGPDGTPVQGRLYGPAVFPLTLRAVATLAGASGCPLIAGAGIYSPVDVEALFSAGAAAVQFDTVLWTEPELVLGGAHVAIPERLEQPGRD